MILYADFRNDVSRMGFVPVRGKATWVSTKGRDASIGLFASLETKVSGLRGKIRVVAVAEGSVGRDVSWSGVRAAVSFGNTLAFALGVPVRGITIDGAWTMVQVTEALRALPVGNAAAGERLLVTYVGEPNITVPAAG